MRLDEPVWHALLQALHRITPDLAVRASSDEAPMVLLSLSRCRRIRTHAGTLARLRSLLQRLDVRGAHWAWGADPPSALTLAWASMQGIESPALPALPLEPALRYYASPFAALSETELRDYEQARLRFEQLGVRTLADWAKLPTRELTARLGAWALRAHEHWHRRRPIVWSQWSPPLRIAERRLLEPDEQTLQAESLLFLLKQPIERVFLRLAGLGLLATHLVLKLSCERYSSVKQPERELRFELPLPQGSARSFLAIVQERLHRLPQSLESPVISLELVVLASAPSRAGQRRWLDTSGPATFPVTCDDSHEAWSSLVGRLSERLGRAQVFQSCLQSKHLPEHLWRAIDPAVTPPASPQSPHSPLLPERPLRLLSPPWALERVADRLRPVTSARAPRGILHPPWQLQSWQSEERIVTHWEGTAPITVRRTYFRVTARSLSSDATETLWLYRDEHGLYLHGVFE